MEYRINIKKLKLSLLLILLMPLVSNAQNWPLSGAKWTYCLFANGHPAGEYTIKVIGDTLIEGKSYSIIEEELDSNKEANTDKGMRTLFTRYENDTIYRLVNNQEYLFFTFNLNVGDVFSTFRSSGWMWNDSSCSSVLPLKVIEKSELELNGELFNSYILEDTLFHYLYEEPNYPQPIYYNLIDRIGVINTLPFINVKENSESCMLLLDYSEVELGHYIDNSFEYTFNICEGSGIEQINDINRFSVYPNPAIDYVEFVYELSEFDQESVIVITDMNGKQIQSFSIKYHKGIQTWDIRKIPSGSYIFTLKTKYFEKSGKLIIQ